MYSRPCSSDLGPSRGSWGRAARTARKSLTGLVPYPYTSVLLPKVWTESAEPSRVDYHEKDDKRGRTGSGRTRTMVKGKWVASFAFRYFSWRSGKYNCGNAVGSNSCVNVLSRESSAASENAPRVSVPPSQKSLCVCVRGGPLSRLLPHPRREWENVQWKCA